ncbi:lysM and putative peptidoglycan-binding domain-containing protein 3 [Gastrophryne carolinensis]
MAEQNDKHFDMMTSFILTALCCTPQPRIIMMTSKPHPRSYVKPATVMSTAAGHSYHFAPMASSEDDVLEEDAEEYELRPRGREKNRRGTSRERLDDIILISKDIKEGDTLNSIALRHSCMVADLKRANNLINEQDFFALRTIKIPVKRFSLLTDPQFSTKGKPSSLLPAQHSEDPVSSPLPSESVDSFLQEVDRDIEQIVRSTDVTKENLHEVVSALGPDLHFGPDHKLTKPKDPHFGADWGLRWWMAVVIMVIVGVVTPVFYFLYYEVLEKEPHPNTSHPAASP